jgi:formate dehydrogenase iron-sulfur subunit
MDTPLALPSVEFAPPCGSSCGADAGGSSGCGSTPCAEPTVATLIDRFLAEQGSMTAAERFARHHDEGQPTLAPRYTDLMPATPPGPGQQYAFEVDLDACTGCKACVTACHSLNGLDEDEAWRSVGLLVDIGDAAGRPGVNLPGPQHVTSACHHCVDPGCLKGCPVDAYEKDPITGIVAHLDDQCIGCSYCTLTCPYEVPQYDRDRGIVRKCDLCQDRLADGEAPACVQGCPTHAIAVRLVDVEEAVAAAAEPWPIAAPDPAHTAPTTTYRSSRDLRAAEPADLHDVRTSHAHPPLAIMLVLTQVAVGTFLIDLLLRATGLAPAAAAAPSALLGLLVAVVALGASVLHLGRPQYAYRAVIGLRHSWLSREIVAFGAFAGVAVLNAAVQVLGLDHPIASLLPPAVAVAGIAGVLCSAMIYAVTGRRWWRLRTLAVRFGLTTVVGGLVVLLAVATATGWRTGADVTASVRLLALALVAGTACKLVTEVAVLRHLRGPADDELARTARLLVGPLATASRWRVALGGAGGILLPLGALLLAGADEPHAAGMAAVALLATGLLVAGELIERWQMFTASSPRRMPGGMR